MAEKSGEDKIKIEMEIPKDQIKIEGVDAGGEEKATEQEPRQEKAGQSADEAKKDEDEPMIAGYKAADIFKAPLEPPEPEDKKPPSGSQKKLLVIGFGLVIGGLLAWPVTNLAVAMIIIIAGATLVAIGTLVRV